MAKVERYQPCDKDGKLGKAVMSAAEFKDFCVFMSDQSDATKSIRKKAYDRISETGVATAKAKIDFVRANSLGYIKSQLKSSNSLSAQALSTDAAEWDDEFAEKFITEMGREFRGLVVAVGGDVFDGMLLASNMTEQARKALVKALWSGDEFADEVIDAALRAERGQAAKALADWRKTPEARSKMSSGLKSEMASDRMSLDAKYGVYAPLLKFLTEQMGVAQRVEYFARFEDYANSGFFDQDLALVEGVARNGLYATPAAHGWKEMAAQVMTGQEPQPTASDVRKALHLRLAEVGMKISVPSIKNGKPPTWTGEASKLSSSDIDELAVSGHVDSLTICSDKTALVSFVTSNNLVNTQKDQWSRHFIAVENVLPSLGLTGASYRVLAPCLIADRSVARGAPIFGATLGAWFSGQRKMDPEIQGVINAVPFMLELVRGSKTVLATADKGGVGAWAGQLSLELIGSNHNAWPLVQAAIAASSNPEAEFDRQMLTMASRVLDGISQGARLRGADAVKICGVSTMDKAGGEMEVLIGFISEAVKNSILSLDVELLPIAKSMLGKLGKASHAFEPRSRAAKEMKASGASLKQLAEDLRDLKKSEKEPAATKLGGAVKGKAGAAKKSVG